ncbi:hypothetical protein ASPWEDRAFT_23855 [Aspergillus wentii DTO 134E9]|uniref:Uncharacterized protein n=1 Tax=Aspergillus wentii DTO 134E9 TaxID=1073089 RepID=A0A1L9S3Q4_ASPWE|nr:uncharacterized protein ASPWEDRAFT_23855 [Aspergillus wentii DTO 134E9]OJJ41795.1 hypothetical protein ASPWEDRAFT_23855 [Aspergillus wentii DTO 134E9]
MRLPSLLGPATVILTSIFQPSAAQELSFTSVSKPDLDLSSLGRVAFTGNFDAVSIYSYTNQSETTLNHNGSQSILTPLPNGVLTSLSNADAEILAMCPFTNKDGKYSGIFVGGNFTNLGGVKAEGVAMFNLNSNEVTALPGINGSVSALLCDQDTNSVYVGGDFNYKNTTNAVAWVDGKGWSRLPFDGLNGPVTSILKDDDGHIVFGGSFDGIGNSTSTKKTGQVINLSNATITSDALSSKDGYSSPKNIICQTGGEDGEGKTWLLDDYSPGFWRADMNFTYNPSRIRLYNTHFEGRGTKSFLFRALPDNGIMNLTYTDSDNKNVSCDASCPLSDNSDEEYREFRFVNNVGMKGFQLEVLDWYGQGAGLNGIEVFTDDIYAYAINDFNEPTCAESKYPSEAKQSGSWSVTGSGQSNYLTAKATGSDATSTSIVFEPDVQQSGNYSVLLYTPGCTEDGTCDARGIVNVTATVSTDDDPVSTDLYQTNDYEKYDTIYTGHVDASSSSFRPSVTLTPKPGQGDITVVASRVKFQLIKASKGTSGDGDLNGLYDFDPTSKTTNTNFTESVINEAGLELDHGASITALAIHDKVIYAGGNFSKSGISNIMYFDDGNATAMPEGGLNAQVASMAVLDDLLYVGGNFTDSSDGGNSNLQNVAAYSFDSKAWVALGGGVNGPVSSVLEFPLNVSTEINETTVAVSGRFDELLAFDDTPAVHAPGFAIWVPSRKNWLQNLNVTQSEFVGQLSTYATAENTTIIAGNFVSNGLAADGAVSLVDDVELDLLPLLSNTKINSSGGGVLTGVYDTSSKRNLTILGGQFNITTNNGSTVENLALIDGNHNMISGLGAGVDSNSTFMSLLVSNNTLWAGGNVTGTVNGNQLAGFVAYDLSNSELVKEQPPALNGGNVTVNSIASRPSSEEIYFGGSFKSAGNLPCPSVCYYDPSAGQWSRPGVDLEGTVLSLKWTNSQNLMAIGDLKVNDEKTKIATYNVKEQMWTSFKGASATEIPGTVTAFTPASTDVSTFWLAGQSTNGSSFITSYDGSKFVPAGDLFDDGTIIQGLEVIPISSDHKSDDYLNKDLILIVTGQLVIPDFGNASAALFDGIDLTPFMLSSKSNGQPGTMSRLFMENQNPYTRGGNNHHSNGIVVLISFCLALACVFLIVIAGVIMNKIQRRRQGYMPSPQAYGTDRPTNMQRLPPEYLFNTLKQPNPGAPAI